MTTLELKTRPKPHPLKAWLVENRVKQGDLAAKLGTHCSLISKALNGFPVPPWIKEKLDEIYREASA